MSHRVDQGNRELVVAVRAGLVARGSSLSEWCRRHSVNRSWAYEALMGRRNGDQAQALRRRLMDDAGL